jgi:hypothetical protein
METGNFAIQPCQSKFKFWKVRADKDFGGIYQIFPSMFGPPINSV